MRRLSVALLVCALACSKKDDKAGGDAGAKAAGGTLPVPQAPAPPKPKYADTTSLWAMAPANSTWGIVVGDGVLPRRAGAANGRQKGPQGKPWAKKVLGAAGQGAQQARLDFMPA